MGAALDGGAVRRHLVLGLIDCRLIVEIAVDAHAPERMELARRELHRLLDDQNLNGIPLLVCLNKVDLEPHISKDDATRDFIGDVNAPALREIAERLQEAIDRNLWTPKSNSARARIAGIIGS